MLTAPHQGTGCRLHRMNGRLEAGVKTGERGTTALEFTVVVALLFTLVFGIIDFGRALYTYHFVSYAAHEATRWASVRGANCTGLADGCPAQQSDITTYVQKLATGMGGIDPNAITITPANPWPTGNSPGNPVKVTVTYNFKFLLPFMPANAINMSSTSQMVISQ